MIKINDVLNDINPLNVPITEDMFNADYYLDYLKNEHFHHSEKGCDIEMKRDGTTINKICKTHDKVCSKTGWELNWYLGNNNHLLANKFVGYIQCQQCGKTIYVNVGNAKYCRECAIERNRYRTKMSKIKKKVFDR